MEEKKVEEQKSTRRGKSSNIIVTIAVLFVGVLVAALIMLNAK